MRGRGTGRRARVGLRGRIALSVLLALLVPSVVLTAVSYRIVKDRADHDYRAQILSSTVSDLISAGNSIKAGVKPTAMASATEAMMVRKFNTFAVFALKPEGDGFAATDWRDYLPHPNPDFNDFWPPAGGVLGSDGSNAEIDSTPVLEFSKTGLTRRGVLFLDEHHIVLLHTPGKPWLTVGAVVGVQGPLDRFPGAPIVAVEYHFLQPVEDQANAYLRNLALVSTITVAVGALLAWLIAGRVQRPVRAAGSAAQAFGEGDLGIRLPVAGRDELAELSSSFNDMADQLQQAIDRLTGSEARQKQFVADVSHELRTPTASLLAAATALDNPDTRDSAAGLIAPQLRRLATLTEDLLEISRMDAGEARLDLQPVDLAGLVADVVAHCEDPGSVQVESEGDTVAYVDARRLHTVVGNLVANALRHGAAPVRLTVRGTAEGVTVRVADAGPGVPEDLRERIFDRFVRGDASRTGAAGNGLGLAIARENVRLHHGTLTVENDGGAVFTLFVPKAEPPVG